MLHGARALTFVIGGADGLPAALVGARQLRLSLSALTLPHRMARLVLLRADLPRADHHPRRAVSPLSPARS